MVVDVSVVLPCRNEERTIGICINKILRVFKENNINGEIIVSDSSNDRSPLIAEELGATVVKHSFGYGDAYLVGFKVAKGKFIFMGDSDNTYDFFEIPRFLIAVENADMVIGSRFKGMIRKRSMPWLHKYLGNPIFSFLIRMMFNTKLTDVHSGFRVIRKEALDRLNLLTTGMEFASEMIIKALRKRLRIKEIPITYHPRKGKSKLNSFRDGWKHLRFMLLYSPTHLFFIPGLILMLLSIIIGISSNLLNLVIAGALFILGYQVIMLGYFAKTYAVTHLGERSRFVEKLISLVSLEKGIGISIFFIILGLILAFISKYAFNVQFPKVTLVTLAVVLFVISLQTFFNVFFLSIIGIEQK